MKYYGRLFAGEFIGTFLMVFFGVGAAAVATLLGTMTGNYQVGMVWGITIAIAIYVCRHLSGAHFNPAVSFAMVVAKRMPARELPAYLLGQFTGALLAGISLIALFDDSIVGWLKTNGFTFLEVSSASSVWVEQFPNNANAFVPTWDAFLAEFFCVVLLIVVIFSLTSSDNTGRPNNHLAPLFIGLTVTIIVGTIGPLTNACLNPARDFGPRIAGFFAGWTTIAFYPDMWLVYYLAPLAGGITGALLYTYCIAPLHRRCINDSSIPCDPDGHLCQNPNCDREERAQFERGA